MGDVAQIMAAASAASSGAAGVSSSDPSPFRRRTESAAPGGGASSSSSSLPRASSSSSSGAPPKKAKLNRELAGILGTAPAGEDGPQGAPPLMPTRALALGGLKARRDAKRAKRWVWKSFANAARKDGALFCHWVRADAEPLEYPFARFNRKLEIVRYTDAEVRVGWGGVGGWVSGWVVGGRGAFGWCGERELSY